VLVHPKTTHVLCEQPSVVCLWTGVAHLADQDELGFERLSSTSSSTISASTRRGSVRRTVPSGVNSWRQLCPAKDAPPDDDDDEVGILIPTSSSSSSGGASLAGHSCGTKEHSCDKSPYAQRRSDEGCAGYGPRLARGGKLAKIVKKSGEISDCKFYVFATFACNKNKVLQPARSSALLGL